MKFKNLSLFMIILVAALIICGSNPAAAETEILKKDWQEIAASARGEEINFYMWGGNRTINNWIDSYLASNLKENYGINLKRVPMGPDDFLNKLLGEKQIGKKEGSIDLLWINGENFKTAMEKDLLWGPFVNKLPNYKKYLDPDSESNTTDFGYPTQGYEAPYSRAQFVFIYDQAKVEEPPQNYKELISWIKEHPGKFTYPALPDFTGSAFVRHVIYNETGGYSQYYELENEEKVREKIRPALEKLAALEPYLWRKGKTYPATIAQLDNMFADGEVWMSMGYDPSKASSEINKGNYPDSARTFVLEEGTISNSNFLAIPFNSSHKEAALLTINFLESFEAQYSKYKPANWGALPVLSYDKLSGKEKEKLKQLELGEATLSPQKLAEHRVPELPADLVPIIEEEWQKIVGE